jgi:hypothetical protein
MLELGDDVEVVNWDPVVTAMKPPSIRRRHDGKKTLIFADDIDIALLAVKGGTASLVTGIQAMPSGLVATLLMTATAPFDRAISTISKVVDAKVTLVPMTDECIAELLRSRCSTMDVEQSVSLAHGRCGDVRSAMLAADVSLECLQEPDRSRISPSSRLLLDVAIMEHHAEMTDDPIMAGMVADMYSYTRR